MLMRPSLFEPDQPVPLWQSEAFAATLRALGRDASLQPLGLVGRAMVVQRKIPLVGTVRFTSGGPLWLCKTGDQHRVEVIRQAKLSIVNAAAGDVDVMRKAGFAQIKAPIRMSYLETHVTMELQLAQAHPKWRAETKQNRPTRIRRFDPNMDAWIFTKDQEQQRQKGYRTLPSSLVNAFARTNPNDALVCLSGDPNAPHAAMLFLRHGATATYHIGWVNPADRRRGAHHQMLAETAVQLAKEGVRWIDLGRLTGTPAGLQRFKRRSGAQSVELGGTWAKMPWR